MNGIEWKSEQGEPGGDLPYATHSGELEILGLKLRCYRLNTGEAIIHADDMNALFEMMGDPAP